MRVGSISPTHFICIGIYVLLWDDDSLKSNVCSITAVSAFLLPNSANAIVKRSSVFSPNHETIMMVTATNSSDSHVTPSNNQQRRRPQQQQQQQQRPYRESQQRRKSRDPRRPPPGVELETFQLQKELQRINAVRQPKAAKQAEALLNKKLAQFLSSREGIRTRNSNALDLKTNQTRACTKPDEVCFNICIMGHVQQSWKDAMAPIRAEALLRRMLELHKQGCTGMRPSIFTYNAVMEAWSKSKGNRAPHSVLRLFAELQQDSTLQVNTYSYNMLLGVHAKSKEPESYQHAEQLVSQMEHQSLQEGNKRVRPDRNTYNLLLTSYARNGQAEQASELVDTLYQRYCDGETDLKPNHVWTNNVIHAWSKSGSTKAGERGDALLQEMEDMYTNGQRDVRPDTTTYNQVMNAYAQVGNTKQVMELLEQLERIFAETGELGLEPDAVTYSTAINAYAKCSENSSRKAAEKASALLKRMEDLYAAGGRKRVNPNLVTYNTVIKIFSKVGDRAGLQQAMGVLRKMQERAIATGNERLQPNSLSYAELIHGWSRSGLRDAGYKSEALLYETQELPPSRQRGVRLTSLYNSVIKSWAKSGDDAAPRKAESLLTLLEQKFYNGDTRACPDTVTFLCISDVYAKTRLSDAQDRIEALLRRMDKLVKAGATDLQPNRPLYNSILNALATSCQQGAALKAEELLLLMQNSDDENLRPDIVTYATVIDCHTKSGEPSNRAEQLLEFVEENYQKGDTLLKPNAVFYSAVLQALAKSKTNKSAVKAEQLLRRNNLLFKEGHDYARPHAIVYNAVIDAIARSGGSGEKAEALLAEMEELYEAGDEYMKPSRRTINAVMLAYRHEDGGSQKAEKLLQRMEELAEDGVYSDISPGTVAYNCVIGAISDSKETDAADRAQAMLDRMIQLYAGGNWAARPDEITYSCVIEAWLKRNDEQGSKMAHELLQEFLDMVEVTKIRGEPLATDAVWNVINAYKQEGGSDSNSSIARVFEEMESEFDEINW